MDESQGRQKRGRDSSAHGAHQDTPFLGQPKPSGGSQSLKEDIDFQLGAEGMIQSLKAVGLNFRILFGCSSE